MRFFRTGLAALLAAATTPAFAQLTETLNATSGTNVISTNYTTTGGLTLNLGFFADYLVLAGGGGGGGSGDSSSAWGGGGGGAGGLLTGSTTLSGSSYTVVVGGGGAGGQFSATAANQQGKNGANSVFGAITSTGGGGGGSFQVAGNAGGSGGGGGGRGTGSDLRTAGGAGNTPATTPSQGFNGGASRDDNSSGRSAGGGGGGAGAVGGTGGTNVTTAGNGGAGSASTITGASVTYGGGGGGGAQDTNSGASETAGTGGSGGGGAGSTSGNATAGTDGLGGGGGGVGTNGAGGRGGAGRVIVRYQGASLGNIGGTVTSGTGSAAGYTLHTFTTTGTATVTSALNLSGVNMNTRLGASLTGTLTGNGGLTYNGPGSLTLAAANTFSGTTRATAGSLKVANAAGLQSSTLDMNSGDAGTVSFGQNSTLGGLAGSRNLSLGGFTLSIGNNDESTTYSGGLSNGQLTKIGSGGLTLSGSNSFTGQTTVLAGTLILNNENALAPTAAVVVASGATLQANQAIRIGYLESQGTVTGSNNLSATLTVTQSGNIGGIANGTDGQGTFAAGIVKLSSGTSTVNAANTYTGLTWVREGSLALGAANPFAAASSLTVDSGATLDRAGYSATVTNADLDGTVGNAAGGGLLTVTGTLSGSGVVNGDVTVTGVHAPGNSPGIQTFSGDLTYGSGAVIAWELTDNTQSNSPVVYDQVVLTGTADLTFAGSNALLLSFSGEGSLVNWNDSFWNVNRAWTVFDLASGEAIGFNNLSLGGSLLDANGLALDGSTRGYFGLAQSGQDVVLTFTAVPEPSTLMLLGMGGVCAAFMLRRRRRG